MSNCSSRGIFVNSLPLIDPLQHSSLLVHLRRVWVSGCFGGHFEIIISLSGVVNKKIRKSGGRSVRIYDVSGLEVPDHDVRNAAEVGL